MRVAVLISAMLVTPILGICSGEGTDARISGTVNIPSDFPVKLTGASVIFQSSTGTRTESITNRAGEYSAFLKGGADYTVTVSAEGFCTVHRPAFRLKRGAVLRFDFTTTVCGYIDRALVNSGEVPEDRSLVHPDSGFPYHDERTLPFRNSPRGLIVAFGIFKERDNWARYEALPIPEYPGSYLPVTVSFGTYTVRADTAVLNRKTNVLRAEGNVSVADGSASPPRAASCVVLALEDPEAQPESCQGIADSK